MAQAVMSLPMHPYMATLNQGRVVETLLDAIKIDW
jgi:dTDP-4-amino-4,6-dideoxygalactose transaminase